MLMKPASDELWQQLSALLESAQTESERVDILNAAAENWLNLSVTNAALAAEQAKHEGLNSGYAHGVAKALNMLAACYYRQSDSERATITAQEAQALCETLGDQLGAAFALNTIGATAITTGNYKIALESFLQSLAIRKSAENSVGVATSLMNVGNVYHSLGDHALALQYFFESLELREKINDTVGIGTSLGNIGQVYEATGDYQLALDYFRRSLVIKQETGNRMGLIAVLKNVAETYLALQEPEATVEYAGQCLAIAREQANRVGEADALHCLGLAYEQLGQPAGDYFRESLGLRKLVGNRAGESASYCAAGRQYFRDNDFNAAFECFLHALAIARDIQSVTLAAEAHRALADSYEQTGDTEQAFYHFKQWHLLHDKIFNERSNSRIRNLHVIHEVEHTRQQAEIYRKHNIELAELNQALALLNQENKEIMGIVAHDLRNPLSSIITFSEVLRLHTDKLSRDETNRHISTIGNLAFRALEIVKKLLESNAVESMSGELKSEAVDVAKITDSVTEEYLAPARKKGISFQTSIKPAEAIGDRAAIAQILDNLLSNAVKYSPHGRKIFVAVDNDSDGVRLSVRDEGPGITEADQRQLFGRFARLSAKPTGGEQSIGLGLSIVKKLVEAMNGKIQCDSKPGQGAAFIVRLPAANSTTAETTSHLHPV